MLVVLYVMDCLRPDFLGCYGSVSGTSPRLDELAQDGVLYENTYANSSWSFPSMISMLTSHYPRTLGTMHELTSLPTYVKSLPEILGAAGFDTVAIAASSWFSPHFGVRGFQRFETVYSHTDLIKQRGRHAATPAQRDAGSISVMAHSEDLNELAFEIFDQGKERDILVMIWSLDTHPPYYVRGEESHFWNSMDDCYREGEVSLNKLRRLYCDMLLYNDTTFGALVKRMKEVELYDQSMVLISGDHGVSFGEHGVSGHGRIVYEEQIRVPLIIKFPARAHAGFRQSSPVHLVDLLPTIMDVCGVSYDEGSIEGTSIVPGRPLDVNRIIFSETHQRPNSTYSAAVIQGHYKYMKIHHPLPKNPSVTRRIRRHFASYSNRDSEFTYDLCTSRGKQCTLAPPRVHKEMARKYRDVLENCQRRRVELLSRASVAQWANTEGELDPGVLARLRALGYLDE